MHALSRSLLVGLGLAVIPLGAQAERRVRGEVLSRVLEDRSKYPADPRMEDIPEEERARIEPAPPATRPVREVEPKDESAESAVVMDPVVVEERRASPLHRTLLEHDRAVAAEQVRTVPTTLDAILNRFPILGGYGAGYRAAVARRNVRIMETERRLLIAISMAQDEAEKQELRRYLWDLREIRRW